MNQGPWMSDGMYLVQGALVLAIAAVFLWMKKESRKHEGTKARKEEVEERLLQDDALHSELGGVEVHQEAHV